MGPLMPMGPMGPLGRREPMGPMVPMGRLGQVGPLGPLAPMGLLGTMGIRRPMGHMEQKNCLGSMDLIACPVDFWRKKKLPACSLIKPHPHKDSLAATSSC